jgi:hypothetical protein
MSRNTPAARRVLDDAIASDPRIAALGPLDWDCYAVGLGDDGTGSFSFDGTDGVCTYTLRVETSAAGVRVVKLDTHPA